MQFKIQGFQEEIKALKEEKEQLIKTFSQDRDKIREQNDAAIDEKVEMILKLSETNTELQG